MLTLNKHKIQRTFKFLIFFLSMVVLAGCKPSIDYLDVLVTKAGEQVGEGETKSIVGQDITLEDINPGDKLYLNVITSDDESAHILNHKFRWKVLHGDIGEWQINGTEAGELGENFWDTYSDKTIELRAPDGADSQITLEVTVTCEETSGADNSTTLDIKISSKRSIEKINQKISGVIREKINNNLDDAIRSFIKAGGEKKRLLAEVIHLVTDDFLLEKENHIFDAEAKLQYVTGLLEKTEDSNFIQDIMSKVVAAADHQTCVNTQSKDHVYFDEKYNQQEKYHKSLCDHGMKLKGGLCIEEVAEVADRGTGDSVVLNCNHDEDNSSAQDFSSKAGDGKGEFVPYLRQDKYFVTYRLTEGETYTVTGNVKDFPSILGDKMPATQIYCDLIKRLPFCIKNIAQDDIEDVRLMLKKLLEKKHPIVCGGKNRNNCENQISSITYTQLGKQDRPHNENTINEEYKKQKTNSDEEIKSSAKQNLKDDINPEDYCRTPGGDLPAKDSERQFVTQNRNEGKRVICFSVETIEDFSEDGSVHPNNGDLYSSFEFEDVLVDALPQQNLTYQIDCDAYNPDIALIHGRRCDENPEDSTITLFVAIEVPNPNEDMSTLDFSEYYLSEFRIQAHLEQGDLGNVNAVTIRNRSHMFREATNLNKLNIDTSDTTNMSYMFFASDDFDDESISSWNTSNVTEMQFMFANALNSEDEDDLDSLDFANGLVWYFNQPIGSWDTSSVTDMTGMFFGVFEFNQDLNGWDVSNVEHMAGMFSHAREFNSPINNWDVGQVLNMSQMFFGASDFNQNLSNWQVNADTIVEGMYEGCGIDDDNKHQQ